jgi:hypothetical protein
MDTCGPERNCNSIEKMKITILIGLIAALAFVTGYQVGYDSAPRFETVQLVLPPEVIPSKQLKIII